MGRIVTACFKPNEGSTTDLLSLLKSHLSYLRERGLATNREPITMKSENGTIIEIFEWVSDEAVAIAEQDEGVLKLWAQFSEISEYVPIGILEETNNIFSGFTACN